MAKFNVTVTRKDEYEIEIDESVWTKEEIENWGNTFWGGKYLSDVASSLGEAWMKQGHSYFKEGFGYVRELDSNGITKKVPFNGNYGILPEENFTKGITIRPIEEDKNYETEVQKL